VSVVHAADLPEGSIVAARADIEPDTEECLFSPAGRHHVVFLRQPRETVFGVFRWSQTGPTGGGVVAESRVQRALDAGAQVLRVGDGKVPA